MMKIVNKQRFSEVCHTDRYAGIREESWRGQRAFVLENNSMRVVILPELGGKLASVILKRYSAPDFELAAQPERFGYCIPNRRTRFAACDASGIDDAFPTINPCVLPGSADRFSYTDHGEIWRSSLSPAIWKDSLVLEYESKENPFYYKKVVKLLDDGVRIRWRITNTGIEPFPFLWAMHGLVRYEESMELLYPGEIHSFLNVLDSPQLGLAGTKHFVSMEPGIDPEWDFHRVPPESSGAQMKYYAAEKVQDGWCGYFYPDSQVRCILCYDAEKLPWLGMWITAGGFRGDYNCAWEPSTSFYDGVEQALRTGTLCVLQQRESFDFWAEYHLETNPA